MPKVSPRQKKELAVTMWFIQDQEGITDDDITNFFNFSDKGIKPKVKTKGYEKLMQGKVNKMRHVHELWEKDYFDNKGGWIGWETLFEEMPESVAEFVTKEIFKGRDKDRLMTIWRKVNA